MRRKPEKGGWTSPPFSPGRQEGSVRTRTRRHEPADDDGTEPEIRCDGGTEPDLAELRDRLETGGHFDAIREHREAIEAAAAGDVADISEDGAAVARVLLAVLDGEPVAEADLQRLDTFNTNDGSQATPKWLDSSQMPPGGWVR